MANEHPLAQQVSTYVQHGCTSWITLLVSVIWYVLHTPSPVKDIVSSSSAGGESPCNGRSSSSSKELRIGLLVAVL